MRMLWRWQTNNEIMIKVIFVASNILSLHVHCAVDI